MILFQMDNRNSLVPKDYLTVVNTMRDPLTSVIVLTLPSNFNNIFSMSYVLKYNTAFEMNLSSE